MFEDYMKHFVERDRGITILFPVNCEEFKTFFTLYHKYYIPQICIVNVIKLVVIINQSVIYC
jgi:hypothetical protein